MNHRVAVQTGDFDQAALYRELQQDCPGIGAIVTFTGLVRECSTIIANDLRRKGVRYRIDIPPDLPPLDADRRAFTQICLNVLSNAVKFTPREGEIVFSARDGGDSQGEKCGPHHCL